MIPLFTTVLPLEYEVAMSLCSCGFCFCFSQCGVNFKLMLLWRHTHLITPFSTTSSFTWCYLTSSLSSTYYPYIHIITSLYLLFCVFAIGPTEPVFVWCCSVHELYQFVTFSAMQATKSLSSWVSPAVSSTDQTHSVQNNIRNAILPTCCFSNGSPLVTILLCEHSHDTGTSKEMIVILLVHPPTYRAT